MKIANTPAAEAYLSMLSKLDWVTASTAEEVAVLGKVESVLRCFPSGEAIYEFNQSQTHAKPAVQTVAAVLDVVLMRRINKSQLMLSALGGKSSDFHQEVAKAEIALGI